MVYKPFIDFLQAEKKALASARQKQKLLDQSRSSKNNKITNVVGVRPQQQQQQQQKNKKGNSDLSTPATTTTTTAMQTTNQANSASNFASQAAMGRQKDHPAKNKTVHPKDMTDKEKIGALKNEIDNLRSQVYDTNTIGDQRANPYQSSTDSSTSSSTTTTSASAAIASKGSQHAMFNLTMLSLTVLVVVAIMARLKRRAGSSSTSSSRPSAAFMRMVSVASLSGGRRSGSDGDDPELGRNFELRPQSALGHVDEPEITLTDNTTGYVAPDAADVRLI